MQNVQILRSFTFVLNNHRSRFDKIAPFVLFTYQLVATDFTSIGNNYEAARGCDNVFDGFEINKLTVGVIQRESTDLTYFNIRICAIGIIITSLKGHNQHHYTSKETVVRCLHIMETLICYLIDGKFMPKYWPISLKSRVMISGCSTGI